MDGYEQCEDIEINAMFMVNFGNFKHIMKEENRQCAHKTF